MKFYSEILDTMFDSDEELIDAEKAHLDKIEKEAAERKAKETAVVNRKKEMAKAIEVCDADLDTAYKQLEEARLKSKKIIDEANKQAEELLKPAIDLVKNCQNNRVRAISSFNKEFGPFKTTYTGDRAQQEFERVTKLFNQLFNSFLF